MESINPSLAFGLGHETCFDLRMLAVVMQVEAFKSTDVFLLVLLDP